MAILKAALSQILAVLCMFLLKPLLVEHTSSVWVLFGLQAGLAAFFSRLLGQPVWWQIIHLFFLPAVVFSLSLKIHGVWYLSLLSLMILVFWSTVKGDVPLFLSAAEVTDALTAIIVQQQLTRIIELGAGVGSVVVPLAKRLPYLRITAVEHAPLPWLILRWRCRQLSNVSIIRGNFWLIDLSEFELAFAFLSPVVMTRLGGKVRAEMQPGHWLISSSFAVPSWQPEKTLQLNDGRKTRLFCYCLR